MESAIERRNVRYSRESRAQMYYAFVSTRAIATSTRPIAPSSLFLFFIFSLALAREVWRTRNTRIMLYRRRCLRTILMRSVFIAPPRVSTLEIRTDLYDFESLYYGCSFTIERVACESMSDSLSSGHSTHNMFLHNYKEIHKKNRKLQHERKKNSLFDHN